MTVNHFGSIKHLIARFVYSFLPSKGNAETNNFLTLLNPDELRLFEAQNKFDKKHSFRNVKKLHALLAVSYTHLTLPTIDPV